MSETAELDVITVDPPLISPPLYEIRNEALEAGGSARIMLDDAVPYLPSDAGAQVYGLRAPAAVEILVGDECWYAVCVARQGGAESDGYLEAYPQGVNGPRLNVGYNVGWLVIRPEVFRTGLGQRDGIRGALSLRPGSTVEVSGANPKYVDRFPGAQATDPHKFSVGLSAADGRQALDIVAGDNAQALHVRTVREFSLTNMVEAGALAHAAQGENVPLTDADRQRLCALIQLGTFATWAGTADFIRMSPLAKRDEARVILGRAGVIYALSHELFTPELAVRDPLTRYWLRVPRGA